jgi:hypothetical protein
MRAFIVLIGSLLTFCTAEPSNRDVSFRSTLEINWITDVPPILVDEEILRYYQYLDHVKIFPGIGLTGTFIIENNTSGSLGIAREGNSIMDFVKLHCDFPGSSRNSIPIDAKITEVLIYTEEMGKSRAIGNDRFLPPQKTIEFDVSIPWKYLSNTEPGKIELHYTFDNSKAVSADSTLTHLSYESQPIRFEIVNTPETRNDSIYYLMQKAEILNEGGNFEESWKVCKQLLQMDSTNYNAMRTAADVLWKMNRFDEAIPYAQRGVELLQAAIVERAAKGGVAWYHDGQEYIDKLQFFIDKCQNREKWKWAK